MGVGVAEGVGVTVGVDVTEGVGVMVAVAGGAGVMDGAGVGGVVGAGVDEEVGAAAGDVAGKVMVAAVCSTVGAGVAAWGVGLPVDWGEDTAVAEAATAAISVGAGAADGAKLARSA